MTRRNPLTLAVLPFALLLASGCKKTPEPTGSGGPALLGTASGSKPVTPAVAPSALPLGITWVDPPGWPREAKQSVMRKATYRVPRAASDAEDGELAVFYFGPGQGGSIDANVDRWVKQFSDRKPEEPRRADRTVNGLRQHTVEIEQGTFDGAAMAMAAGAKRAEAKPGWGMLGAVVEAPSGSYFFKLTGPKATVQAARTKFYELLDSIKTS